MHPDLSNPTTVLVAPGAFKSSLSAPEAADAIAAGVRDGLPDAAIVNCPIADGGDGTAEVLALHEDGELIDVEVAWEQGSFGSRFAWLPTDIAVVDMASAGGLGQEGFPQPGPLDASSWAVGNLIAHALDRRPRRLIIGAGGTAFSDGGAGLLSRFGVSLLDAQGRQIPPGARGLASLDRADTTFMNDSVFETEIVVACDVSNPLLGDNGTARVFAPQKGASDQDVEQIAAGLERLAEVVLRDTGKWIGEAPGGGSAGGSACTLWAFLAAELRNGFELIADIIGFDMLLTQCDLLIVGEGTLDAQSLLGKAPVAAARKAKQLGVPVWAFAGKVGLDQLQLAEVGIVIEADLSELTGAMSIEHPAEALTSVSSSMLKKAFGKP
ncbi:MAG: glycerate kinase [Actinomycetota bacterium]